MFSKIDRDPLDKISQRTEKIKLERTSIELFRSTARFFASEDEKNALQTDISTLMVLQHYGVPTRLLDWSLSPYVALYFAVSKDDNSDGELWSFNYDWYIQQGNLQWQNYPGTSLDTPMEVRFRTAFSEQDPPADYFVCVFYKEYFHRITAQEGIFTLTARLGQDHALIIKNFMTDQNYFHRYIIKSTLKPQIRQILRLNFGVWSGSLYPDTAGAAETVKETFLDHIAR